MALRTRSWLVGVALLAGSCDDQGGAAQAPSASVTASASLLEAAEEEGEETADAGQKTGRARTADEKVTIPAGSFVAGSTPGDRGRDPSLEPALMKVELGEFSIDRLPYPNDPSKPPVTGVTRAKAATLCKERGGRLCSELEWERACKGPSGTRYAGSKVFNQACGERPQTCASGFGVLSMGAAQREWTSSDVAPIKKWQAEAAAVRGSAAKAADVDHRCAHRMAVAPDASAADLGFRCCYGEANEATIPSPGWKATFRKADMPPGRLEKLFAANERLAPLSKDIKYFHEGPAKETILRRGRARGTDAGAPPSNTSMSTAPLLWNPVPGEEVLLVTGQSGDDSFIVAFHKLPDDRYRVGQAMVMKNELGPVVFIYNKYERQRLHWATCWECYGETGNIRWRNDNRVTITQE